jgi:succinoglycan biosynthesis transport protein ExoP
MDLRRQLTIVWHAKLLLVLATVVGGGLAFYLSSLQPKVYEATATAIVGQSLTAVGVDINVLLASQRLSQTYATVATTRPILDRVIQKEGLPVSADVLRDRISTQAPLNSTLITITVSANNPDQAAKIANDIVAELISASPAILGQSTDVQQFIDAEFAATQADIVKVRDEINQITAIPSPSFADQSRLQDLQSELASLRSAFSNLLARSSTTAANGLTVIEPAVSPTEPSGPRILVNTILGAMAVLALALGLIFARDYLDDTIKQPDQVELAIGTPPLGVVGEIRGRGSRAGLRLASLDEPRSQAAEAFRALRTNLEFSRLDAPLRRLLVTSAVAGEGKSTTAANLAIAFAYTGRRTLLVDADLRKPGIHRLFELTNAEGLTSLLRSDKTPLDEVIQPTIVNNLLVLTSGPLPPNPAEVLRSHRMETLMDRLNEAAEVVILDSPPLAGLADGVILSTMVDGTLLVIRAGKTRRGALKRALEALGQVDAPLLGVAINRAADESFTSYYYDDAYAPADKPQRSDRGKAEAKGARSAAEGRDGS